MEALVPDTNGVPDEEEVVFTTYITLKNGKRLYAKQYGKKAFMLRIRKKKK